MRLPVPEGYVRVRQGSARAVVVAACAAALDDILDRSTLFDWAREHAERREYMGRGPAFGVPLPQCDVRVVVMRARHGGLLGPMLGEIFVVPTRAPRELAMSLFLRHLGVATPVVVGFVTYSVAPLLRRADVMTAEVPNARDLGAFLALESAPEARLDAWRATARLLQRLTQNGVWHPDLNAKNVLLMRREDSSGAGEGLVAVLLDVDRVRLVVPGDPHVGEANLARLLRSLRKRARDPRNGTPASERELTDLAQLVRRAVSDSAEPAGEGVAT